MQVEAEYAQKDGQCSDELHTDACRCRDPFISIVIPCYNEEQVIELCIERITTILDTVDANYELLFVNDGSTDRTMLRLIQLAQRSFFIKVIALSRNFGKEAALSAGLDHANGDVVIPMDADLQDPPELILDFLEKWREGYDIVYGIRSCRESDTAAKRLTAKWFYRVFNRLSGVEIPENTGDFRLMDRRVVDALKKLPERSRFMKGLFSWVGFKSMGIPYKRCSRVAGKTKFSFWKLWNFALDGLISFSTVPLRIWSYCGAILSLLSFLYASFIILRILIYGKDVPGYASLITVMLFFGGIQLLTIGVLGEYISRLFLEVKQRPLYLVDQIYSFSTNKNDVPLDSKNISF